MIPILDFASLRKLREDQVQGRSIQIKFDDNFESVYH